MGYKEKYNKLVEAIKVLQETNPSDEGIQNWVNDNVPEFKESEDEKVRKAIIAIISNYVDNSNTFKPKMLDWLEKQGEQEQLYIRFGEIPTDEKSKIYRGEIEVGTENGVSVYPAFRTNEGDIVLGLNLPITKTTLYTQQHLIEYDDRPCYLVKGDYVGKDTDGQTLINNVSIIEKIDNYRVKEKKQDEQNPTDKEGPKFKDGEWIVYRNGVWQICNIGLKTYYELLKTNNEVSTRSIEEVDANSHLWTINDAKDGDVLALSYASQDYILIYKGLHEKNFKTMMSVFCFYYVEEDTYCDETDNFHAMNCGGIITPATKEQRDLLFQKMHEAGYEWDAEKKELKKIEDRPMLTDFFKTEYERGKADAISEMKKGWTEDDKKHMANILTTLLMEAKNAKIEQYKSSVESDIDWVYSLKNKDRIQSKQEWSEEDEENRNLINTILWESVGKHLDVPEYGSVITQGDAASLTQWLKALKERIVD